MMQKPDLLRPTLIGGTVFGLASSIPGINLGNCCCCLWLFAAGWLATLLYARAGRAGGYAIKPSDGALVGLIAGLFGGFVSSILETLLRLMFGDRLRQLALSWLDNASIPPELQDSLQMFRQALEQEQGALESLVSLVVSLLGNLFFFALFSTIAGTLTALILAKGPGTAAPPSIPGGGTATPSPGGWRPPSPPPPAPMGSSTGTQTSWSPPSEPPRSEPQTPPPAAPASRMEPPAGETGTTGGSGADGEADPRSPHGGGSPDADPEDRGL